MERRARFAELFMPEKRLFYPPLEGNTKRLLLERLFSLPSPGSAELVVTPSVNRGASFG